jgi:hypothetical protein
VSEEEGKGKGKGSMASLGRKISYRTWLHGKRSTRSFLGLPHNSARPCLLMD